MSLFSEERVEHIAEKIYQELTRKGLIKAGTRVMEIKTAVKKGYVKFYKVNEEVEILVKKRISSMTKAPDPESPAYKVLFEKQFLDEWKKH